MVEQKNIASPQLQNDEDEIDLIELAGSFFRVAKKVWWLFVLLAVVGIGGLALAMNLVVQPQYRCEAAFTVSTGSNNGFDGSVTAADQIATTFPYILESDYFNSVLLETLGVEELNGTIRAETVPNSNMVTLQADAPTAEEARSMLDAAMSVYPQVARFVLGSIEFHLLDTVETPTEPYNVLSPVQILVFGGAGGLLLAAGIVLLMAMFNNTLKTTEDMEKISRVEYLGALPEVHQKARKNSNAARYISALDPRSTHGFRESVRALNARLQASMQEQQAKTLLVTSSAPGEGRSTVAINLAEQLAQHGNRVLLVDMDLRSQQDARLLGCGNGMTAEEVLNNKDQADLRFVRKLKHRGIYFWGGKQPAVKPVRTLTSRPLRKILDGLRNQVDYIILDTPPCGLYQDAAILADWADAVLFVVRYDRVTASEVSAALSLLDNRKAAVLGYIFNNYPQTNGGYGYGYGRYGYGSKYGYGSYGSKYSELPEEEALEYDPAFKDL